MEPGAQGRDPKSGRFAPKNDAGLTHGARRYEESGVLPAEVHAEVAAFRASIEADAAAAITTARLARLVEAQTMCLLYSRDIKKRGPMTPRGRVRASARELGTWIDRWGALRTRSRRPRAASTAAHWTAGSPSANARRDLAERR